MNKMLRLNYTPHSEKSQSDENDIFEVALPTA